MEFLGESTEELIKDYQVNVLHLCSTTILHLKCYFDTHFSFYKYRTCCDLKIVVGNIAVSITFWLIVQHFNLMNHLLHIQSLQRKHVQYSVSQHQFTCFDRMWAKKSSERTAEHVMKIVVLRGSAAHEGPADVSIIIIIIEGSEVLDDYRCVSKACLLLMGFIYAMNLSYPPKRKYTFEVFQKLFLELNVLKMSPKVHALCNKLVA